MKLGLLAGSRSAGSRWARIAAAVGIVAVALSVSAAASAQVPAHSAMVMRLDAVVPVPMSTGDSIVLSGAVRTSIDGTLLDAWTQANENPKLSAETRLGGLYDFEAGGLHVVEQNTETHVYKVVPTGSVGPACTAARVASPCLAPRFAQIAHERLVTEAELAQSLTGGVAIDYIAAPVVPPPPVPAMTPAETRGLEALGVASLIALLGTGAFFAARARRSTPLGQVRTAARQARRATRRDATLAGIRRQIDTLVVRAESLDVARRACLAKLAKMDLAGLEQKRAGWGKSQAPEAGEALAWLTAESAEAARLQSDLSSTVVGLERIASALRVLALRAREHRGTRARVATGQDPVDMLGAELDLRDDAIAEAERV